MVRIDITTSQGEAAATPVGDTAGQEATPSSFPFDASIIGPKYFCDPRLSLRRRAAWLLLFVVACGVTLYQAGDRVAHYLAVPTYTHTSLAYAHRLPLPVITACDHNIVKRSYAESHAPLLQLYEAWYACYDEQFPGLSTSDVPFCERGNNSREKRCCDETLPNPFTHRILAEGGERFEEVVDARYTVWRRRNFDAALPEFRHQTRVFPYYGLCYSLNGGGRVEATSAGPFSTYSFMFKINAREYVNTNSVSNVGLTVFLHSARDQFLPWNNGVEIERGSAVAVRIEIARHKYLAKPGGDGCEDGRRLRYFPAYSQQNCLFECGMMYSLERCRCSLYFYPDAVRQGYPECRTMVGYDCAMFHFERVMHDEGKLDLCRCRKECEFDVFDWSSTSMMQATSQKRTNYCHNYNATSTSSSSGGDGDAMGACDEGDFTIVQINLNELRETRVVELAAYSEWALLSDIGGTLGVFLGSALLTFVEILDYILSNCHRNTKRNN